jgi:hypothetical protein
MAFVDPKLLLPGSAASNPLTEIDAAQEIPTNVDRD